MQATNWSRRAAIAAAMAGIARENVSRILNDWMRAKLVSRLAGYYCLENKAAIEREVGI